MSVMYQRGPKPKLSVLNSQTNQVFLKTTGQATRRTTTTKRSLPVVVMGAIPLFVIVALIFGTLAGLPLETRWRLGGLVLLAALVGWALTMRLSSVEDRSALSKLFLTAYGMRLMFGLALATYLITLRGTPIWSYDASVFEQEAVRLAMTPGAFINAIGFNSIGGQVVHGPAILYAIIYILLGDTNPFLSLIVNVFLGALTPIIVWKLGKELNLPPKVVSWSAWLMVILPTTVIYSSTHLKEAPVALLLVSLYYLIMASRRGGLLQLILSVPLLVLLIWYRDRLGWIIAVVFAAGFLIAGTSIRKPKDNDNRRLGSRSRLLLLAPALGLVILAVWPVLNNARASGLVARVFAQDWWRISAAGDPSNISPLAFLSGGGLGRTILLAPLGALFVMLLPLPWFVLSPEVYFENGLISIANVVWLGVMPGVLVGSWIMWQSRDIWKRGVVLVGLGGTLGLALSVGGLISFGRHREPFVPFLLILASVGWYHVASKRKLPVLLGVEIVGYGLLSGLYLWQKGFIPLESMFLVLMFWGVIILVGPVFSSGRLPALIKFLDRGLD